MKVTLLTTTDNPFDPFDQWDEWYRWDADHGYHTPGLLARIAPTSNEISESSQMETLTQAIDEIVILNVSGMHKKVTREIGDPEPYVPTED